MIRLVVEGGAQTAGAVARGIPRAEALVFCAEGDEIVGVGALKVPQPPYRNGLAARSGHPLSADRFQRELGYVAVAVPWRGRGIGTALCARVATLAGERALFATTGDDIMLHRILPRLGFVRAGAPWQGQSERVFLMVRGG